MKYFYIGVFIFAVLLCACFFTSRQICKRTGDLECALHRALASEEGGSEKGRDYFTGKALRLWHRDRGMFSCFLSHAYSKEISEDLEELRTVRGEEYRKVCRRLLQRLENIRLMDRPVLENIL